MIKSIGRNRSKEYCVSDSLLRGSDYKGTTSLKKIEDYRLRELIIQDLKIYKCSPLKDIHQRIGKEIPYKRVLEQITYLKDNDKVDTVGQNRWIKYKLRD